MKKDFIETGKIRQGLVAFDLSEADYDILKYLKFFVGVVPAEALHFLHVSPEFDVLRSFYFESDETLADGWGLNETVWEKIKEEVISIFSDSPHLKFSFEATAGKPLEVILAKEAELNTDLLIVGKKVKENAQGILMRNLVRKAKDAILVIPEDVPATMNKILVPVDFSDNSARALEAAVSLAKKAGNIEIAALNVYNLPELSSYRLGKPMSEFKLMVEENITEAFAKFVAKHAAGYEAHVSIKVQEHLKPSVSGYILEHAALEKADFLVIGAKGHSLLDRLLLGSVTEKILSLNDNMTTLVVK